MHPTRPNIFTSERRPDHKHNIISASLRKYHTMHSCSISHRQQNIIKLQDLLSFHIIFLGRPLPLLPVTGLTAAAAFLVVFLATAGKSAGAAAAGAGAEEGAAGAGSGRRPLLLPLPLSNIKFAINPRRTITVTCICTTHPRCIKPDTPFIV